MSLSSRWSQLNSMLRNIICFTLVLTCVAVFAACGPKPGEITGTIESIGPTKIGSTFAIGLTLEGRPETFKVPLAEAHKFGLTKVAKVSNPGELTVMLQEVEATKGWRVKLTCEKKNNPQGPEYLVKSLKKLSGK